MTRGLSSDITSEISNQSIKPIALVEILFPTPQRLTNHYKDITHNSNTYTSSSHLVFKLNYQQWIVHLLLLF